MAVHAYEETPESPAENRFRRLKTWAEISEAAQCWISRQILKFRFNQNSEGSVNTLKFQYEALEKPQSKNKNHIKGTRAKL